MICQHQDDEVEAGIEHLYELYEAMRHDKREPGKLGELKFGLECGGSDGLSGSLRTRCWDVFLTTLSVTAAPRY
jgi:altronate dehydratase